MDKYKIYWIEERLYTQVVESDSEDGARETLFSGEFDWPEPYYVQVQDSVEVEKENG